MTSCANTAKVRSVSDVWHIHRYKDITVFNLDEIEMRLTVKVWNCTGGSTYRYSRDAAAMRITQFTRVPPLDNGEITGRYPGEFIGPEAGRGETLAIVAE